MELICPRCGASSKKTQFVGDFCLSCHLESKKKILPDFVEIVICPKTGLVRVSSKGKAHQEHQRYRASEKRVGEAWVKPDNALIKQIVKRPFKRAGFECKYKAGDDFATILFEGAGGEIIEYKHPIKIVYKKILCPMAERAAGGYFEAIVQLRGDGEKIERYRKKISKALERHTFIAKELDLPEGVDIYVGQKEKIQDALYEMRLKYVRTSKLSGQRRDGKRLYRDTFLVRF
ncbi:MAG: NMD3-related protein [Candidatus Micrarchaeota archaeon]